MWSYTPFHRTSSWRGV